MSEQIRGFEQTFEQNENLQYLIFHNIEKNVRHHRALARWPLHITIVPGFTLETSTGALQNIRDLVRDIAHETSPFRVKQIGDDMYGPEYNVPVTKVESTKLHELHQRFLWDLGSIGCNFVDMTYAGDRYSPHYTWKRGVFPPIDSIEVDRLSIAVIESGTKQMLDTQLMLGN